MNPQLIAEIAKFLGKNIKWVAVIIATTGTAIILGYLQYKKKTLEDKIKGAEEIVRTYTNKIKELKEEQKKIKDEYSERYKEYEENLKKWQKLCQKQEDKIADYKKQLKIANNLIAKLKSSK